MELGSDDVGSLSAVKECRVKEWSKLRGTTRVEQRRPKSSNTWKRCLSKSFRNFNTTKENALSSDREGLCNSKAKEGTNIVPNFKLCL